MKMEKWDMLKLFQEWGSSRLTENEGGVNSIMIKCKNICKCHNVLPIQQLYNLKNLRKE
jgi:hypothetical protein